MNIQVLEIPYPWGARCLAVTVAAGVWFDHFPLTGEQVLKGVK